MNDANQKTIDAVLEQYNHLSELGARTRLILIVGAHGSGKTKVLKALAERLQVPRVNLNLELSRLLLDVPIKRRPLKVETFFRELLDKKDSGAGKAALLDNIELLFYPELKLNPLNLLENNARNRCIIATWPGVYENAALMYAKPDHPEYRRYTEIEAYIIVID